MKAKLILQNGMEFEGTAFGYLQGSIGEVVFNTAMSGYQETLTDPAYYGQIVVMTYPLIGNYGINLDDSESSSPKVSGLIVREKATTPNNFRCELELDDYLKSNKVIGLEGIDTRALTKVLRKEGTMNGIIVLENHNIREQEIQEKLSSFSVENAVKEVSCKNIYEYCKGDLKVAVMDLGLKNSILEHLKKRNCSVKVYPYDTKASEILKDDPDLVLLSSGPGDPRELDPILSEIRSLADQRPVVGISLGHQLLTLAFGGKVDKLRFGHRGSNHPVKDLLTDKVYITAQNHGYFTSELPSDFEVTHKNLNDDTIQGMRHKHKPLFSVQFQPEGSPSEDHYLFDEFLKYAREVQHA